MAEGTAAAPTMREVKKYALCNYELQGQGSALTENCSIGIESCCCLFKLVHVWALLVAGMMMCTPADAAS